MLWNKAAVGNYIWKIAEKKDNIWVKWIISIRYTSSQLLGGDILHPQPRAGFGSICVESRKS